MECFSEIGQAFEESYKIFTASDFEQKTGDWQCKKKHDEESLYLKNYLINQKLFAVKVIL